MFEHKPTEKTSPLRPSGSKNWLSCDIFGALHAREEASETKREETNSSYAVRGTGLHSAFNGIIKPCILTRGGLKNFPRPKLEKLYDDFPKVDKEELAILANETFLFFQDLLKDNELTKVVLAERIDLISVKGYVSPKSPEKFTPDNVVSLSGEPDLVIYGRSKDKKKFVIVVDLKTGYQHVELYQNTQLALYAYPFYEKHCKTREVSVCIFSPFKDSEFGKVQTENLSTPGYHLFMEKLKCDTIAKMLEVKGLGSSTDAERTFTLKKTLLHPATQNCTMCKFSETCVKANPYLKENTELLSDMEVSLTDSRVETFKDLYSVFHLHTKFADFSNDRKLNLLKLGKDLEAMFKILCSDNFLDYDELRDRIKYPTIKFTSRASYSVCPDKVSELDTYLKGLDLALFEEKPLTFSALKALLNKSIVDVEERKRAIETVASFFEKKEGKPSFTFVK